MQGKGIEYCNLMRSTFRVRLFRRLLRRHSSVVLHTTQPGEDMQVHPKREVVKHHSRESRLLLNHAAISQHSAAESHERM